MATTSEIFNFVYDSQTVAQLTHPVGDEALTVVSDYLKGDGYYGRADGFHTVQIRVTEFIGNIEIQGALEVDPIEEDWFTVSLTNPDITEDSFTVDTTGLIKRVPPTFDDFDPVLTPPIPAPDVTLTDSTIIVFGDSALIPSAVTKVKIYNFVGNYVWIRVKVSDWVAGAVNNILLNH